MKRECSIGDGVRYKSFEFEQGKRRKEILEGVVVRIIKSTVISADGETNQTSYIVDTGHGVHDEIYPQDVVNVFQKG